MDSWWNDLDGEIVRCLAEGPMDPAEVGRRLGISAAAVTSLVSQLACEGRARICLVATPVALDNTAVRSFWCPGRMRRVTAEFREEAQTGRRLAVNWCSAFTPPTSIGCDRCCLDSDELGELAALAAPA